MDSILSICRLNHMNDKNCDCDSCKNCDCCKCDCKKCDCKK